jgi:hypothetical protein
MIRSRLTIVIVVSLLASAAMAQSSSPSKLSKPTQTGKTLPKPLPIKEAPTANSCAAYGAGFVKLEGSDTCVQIGGAISIGVGGAMGGRH